MSESLTVFMKTSKLQSRQKTINNINSWKRRRLKYCTIIFFEAIETQQFRVNFLISKPGLRWYRPHFRRKVSKLYWLGSQISRPSAYLSNWIFHILHIIQNTNKSSTVNYNQLCLPLFSKHRLREWARMGLLT